MGFKGIILTDSMNMWAMRKNYEPAEAAIMAFRAGANIVMLSEEVYENSQGNYKQKQQATIKGVIQAVKNGKLAENIIDKSLALILGYKYRKSAFNSVPNLIESAFGNQQHIKLAAKAAKAAIKIVRNKADAWPLKYDEFYVIPTSNPATQDKILECRGIGPNDDRLVVDVLVERLVKNKTNFKFVEYSDIDQFIEAGRKNNLPIILITENYPIAGYDHDVDAQAKIVARMVDQYGDRVIVMALRSDYELNQYPNLSTYICAYSSRPVSAQAIADMLSAS
ncbi:MAG: glycoside hydrolase family 3 protein, partial [Rhizobiales bacterium]|nr:glycoside hydrolase family 3 protein [Hyphomicrobiales bacterium]